jgi:hypothetical protein
VVIKDTDIHFLAEWGARIPVDCEPWSHHRQSAFSAKVDTGFPEKMRSAKNLAPIEPIQNRKTFHLSLGSHPRDAGTPLIIDKHFNILTARP